MQPVNVPPKVLAKRMSQNKRETNADFEEFRSYLSLLARMQLPQRIQARLSASDIVQLTMLQAVNGADDFRGTTKAEMAAWLRQILARNLAHALRDNQRQKRDVKREQSLEASLNASSMRLGDWLAAEQSTPSQKAAFNEQVFELAQALEQLPDDQRRAIELHYWQGLKLGEVAEVLEKTGPSVAGLLHRGLKTLRKRLAQVSE